MRVLGITCGVTRCCKIRACLISVLLESLLRRPVSLFCWWQGGLESPDYSFSFFLAGGGGEGKKVGVASACRMQFVGVAK